jgi:tRNA A58 N-methylase Trm61
VLESTTSEDVRKQLDVFTSSSDADADELSERYDGVRVDMQNVDDVVAAIKSRVNGNESQRMAFLELLQNAALIRHDPNPNVV